MGPGGRVPVNQNAYGHIEVSSDGVPRIAGTPTKVVEIVLDRIAHEWTAEEIHRQHPHLTLAQIHSALAFYYDHQDAVEEDIDRRLRAVKEIRDELGEGKLRLKLRAAGRLP